MKLIKTDSRNDSKWTMDIVEAKSKKFSSLAVEAGNVNCPLSGGSVSTMNCEVCQFCKGIDFHLASSQELVKCSHNESKNVKKASVDEVDRLYISEKANIEEKVSPEDLKSVFARSSAKFEDLGEADIMHGSKIVSAKNISENENDGTSNFIPKFSNSIFDSEIIAKLEAAQKQQELEAEESFKEIMAEKQRNKSEWETDTQKQLDEIGYQPKGSIMSIAHEAEANNPDVSEYKFSIFDNVDERLNKIPEFTDGEKLKSQAAKRKQDISRKKEEDDWESKSSEGVSTSKIVSDFFSKMMGE